MLRILIAVLCMIFTPETCGMSLQQFLGHYEYNCYYNGEKQGYHIAISAEGDPRIYANGKQILFDELHLGDLVMLYTNWQTEETGGSVAHCDNDKLSWVKQVDVIKCPHEQ